ncbi:MAG: hypothetical protein H0W33_11750 [Gammaproteobacteria bacterium]|nr:hypothetical protein [Gammaproteobacteria bacterium]
MGAGGAAALDAVYRRADQVLYAEKRRRGRRASELPGEFQSTLPSIYGEPA